MGNNKIASASRHQREIINTQQQNIWAKQQQNNHEKLELFTMEADRCLSGIPYRSVDN